MRRRIGRWTAFSGSRVGSPWPLIALVAAVTILVLPASAGAYIYWATSSGVGRANLDGSGAKENFITGANAGCGVAVDAGHIYWGNFSGGTIGRANLNGSGVTQNFITGANGPCGVAVDPARIYWANYGVGTFGTTIGRANLDGSGVSQSFIAGANGPCGPAVDGAHVYWANYTTGAIGRANLDGGGVSPSFITVGAPVCWVAVDSAHIYWSNQGANTIGRANLNGSGVDQSFITGINHPCGVAVDAAHIYWAETIKIGRANLDGSGVNHNFIAPVTTNCGIAVDALKPSNFFAFAGLVLNLGNGTARLSVRVPGRGALSLFGRGVLRQVKRVAGPSTVRLLVKARGGAKEDLNADGKVRVTVKLRYAPTGGDPRTKSKTLVLRRRSG
jgi:hypothetical protein